MGILISVSCKNVKKEIKKVRNEDGQNPQEVNRTFGVCISYIYAIERKCWIETAMKDSFGLLFQRISWSGKAVEFMVTGTCGRGSL